MSLLIAQLNSTAAVGNPMDCTECQGLVKKELSFDWRQCHGDGRKGIKMKKIYWGKRYKTSPSNKMHWIDC